MLNSLLNANVRMETDMHSSITPEKRYGCNIGEGSVAPAQKTTNLKNMPSTL